MPFAFRLLVSLALVAPQLLWGGSARAHTTSDSYLTLSAGADTLEARWDIALKDLAHVIPLDDDGDGAITWRELEAAADEVVSYASAHVVVSADGKPCEVSSRGVKVTRHHDESFAVLALSLACGPTRPSTIDVRYSLFFEENPGHRGLFALDSSDATESAVFRPGADAMTFSLAGPRSATRTGLSTVGTFLIEGVWHVLIGFDHVLFLLALLLPAVLRREDRRWWPREEALPVVKDVLRVVTAFTLAHSITLCLAATGVSRVPSSFVETGIALSVALVALNNVIPVFKDDRWTVTFALGLLHGFGFSSVLMELDLPEDGRLFSLVGFNAGVEVGQLLIVALFLPLAFALRRTWLYQRLLLGGGSLVIVVIAVLWTLERAFSLSLIPSGGLPW